MCNQQIYCENLIDFIKKQYLCYELHLIIPKINKNEKEIYHQLSNLT